MIPRRRLPLRYADFRALLQDLGSTRQQARDAVAEFEAEFAAQMATPHAIAVASGRDALCLIVDALELGAGDEVIVPAYTLAELLPLLAARGVKIVPADVDPATFNVTCASVRARIGPRTRAILVLHESGAPCDVVALNALAEAHGIALIEDCAHAAGAAVSVDNVRRPVGGIGRAALFSLEANKALAAFGGGVVATRDAGLAQRIRARVAARPYRSGAVLRKYGFKLIEELGVRSPLYALAARILFAPQRAGAFESFYRRANQRIRVPHAFTGLQARWARLRLRELAARNARLNALWELFAHNLPQGFMAQTRTACGAPAFYNFVARYAGDSGALRQAAQRHGLDLGIGGEVMDDCARLLGYADCPGAATALREAVLIPCWDGMDERTAWRGLERLRAAAAEVA